MPYTVSIYMGVRFQVCTKKEKERKKKNKEAALRLRAISQYILYSLGGTPADKTITLHHFSYQLPSRWDLSAQGKMYMRNPNSQKCPPMLLKETRKSSLP